MSSRATYALGLAVAMVLSDSSIVILALPEILAHYNVTINQVAWVLTLFNLVLAIVAVPAAMFARRVAPAAVCRIGLIVFAAASLGCAVAPSFNMLLLFRGVQAVGGAAAVCAALELLPDAGGSEERAIKVWAAAGVIGAAAGPAIGGILTQTISWKAIFAVQVPLAVIALFLIPWSMRRPAHAKAGRPDISANVALALVSAALTAALFLIVLLLINGWRHTPLSAAAVVTVMPVAAFCIYRFLPPRMGSFHIRAISGAVLIAGGLFALAVLPGADWWWTVLPQVAIGAGLALSVESLTSIALRARSPLGIHGGYTLAARHAGICLGLLILTPVFTNQLDNQAAAAEASATQIVLNSSLSLTHKIQLGNRLADLAGNGKLTKAPSFDSAFAPLGSSAGVEKLKADVVDQVERAITRAFSLPFALAGVMALLAVIPLARVRFRT